jgi:hypothetical protein
MPAAGVVAILAALGLSVATFYRGRKPKEPAPPRPTPTRALSPEERQAILDALHEERFRDLPPAEVFAKLLGEGKDLGSERTMYRVLASQHEVRERRNPRAHPPPVKPELIATGPNHVGSWDITKLLTFEKFVYLYLYVIMDIFSRSVVGWMLADKENAALATMFIDETIAKHDVPPGQLTLHADRGAPMRSKLLIELPGQARHREELQQAAHVERQPVLGERLQDAQVPPRRSRKSSTATSTAARSASRTSTGTTIITTIVASRCSRRPTCTSAVLTRCCDVVTT